MKNHSEENTIINKLISNEEATMNQPFSNSAGMVILTLQQNYLGQTPSQEEWDEFYSKCELMLRQLTIADFLKSDDTLEYQQTLQSELERSLRDSIDYILTRTNEKSNQFDYVTLYLPNENGTYSNVMHVFSLKYVLALVVKAHTDDARFACRYEGSAEERLEKATADRPLRLLSLFRCFKKIQQEGICHQGIRNALILLLNKSYEGVDLIEDPTATVFSFFREGVYQRFDAYYQKMLEDNQADGKASVIVSPDATEPRPSGSGIVQAFVRDSDLSGETMTETVLFNALLVWMKEANSRPLLAIIDPTHEIKNALLTCFVEHGVDVNSLTISGQLLSDYIDAVSENIDFDLGMEKYQFLHDINAVLNMAVSNAPNNNRKDAVSKMQNWIETHFCLKTPEHRTIISDFLSIEQANKDLLQYQLLLMLTNHATQDELRRIEGAIQTYYCDVINHDDIIVDLSEQARSEIDNLYPIVKQFKDDKCLDTIENFFAHWFGSMDNWLKILCDWTEGDCALDSNPLMIDGVETLPCEDWQRLNHLYSMLLNQEFVQSKIVLSDPHIQAIHEKELCVEGEHFVRHKTPYEINRIFLHAIVIKPDDWSALFSKTFEETLLFVKNQLDVGYIATELKKNSYPVRLITQLDYLYQTNRYINNSSETKPKEREINSSTYIDFFQGKNSTRRSWGDVHWICLPGNIRSAYEWLIHSPLMNEDTRRQKYTVLKSYLQPKLSLSVERISLFCFLFNSFPSRENKLILTLFLLPKQEQLPFLKSLEFINCDSVIEKLLQALPISFYDSILAAINDETIDVFIQHPVVLHNLIKNLSTAQANKVIAEFGRLIAECHGEKITNGISSDSFLLQVRYAMSDFAIETHPSSDADENGISTLNSHISQENMDKVLMVFGDENKQLIMNKAFSLSDDASIKLFDGDTYHIDRTIFLKKYMIIAGIDTKENFMKYRQLDTDNALLLRELLHTCFAYDFFDEPSEASSDGDSDELFPSRWRLVDHQANYDALLYAVKVVSQIQDKDSIYFNEGKNFFKSVIFILFHTGLLSINNLEILSIDSGYMARQIELFKGEPPRIRMKIEAWLDDIRSRQEELALVLHFRRSFLDLNEIELKEFLEGIQPNILTIIPNSHQLGLLLQMVTETQCKILLDVMRNQLPEIISNGEALGEALKGSNEIKRTALFEVMQNQPPFVKIPVFSGRSQAMDRCKELLHKVPPAFYRSVFLAPNIARIIDSDSLLLQYWTKLIKDLSIVQARAVMALFESDSIDEHISSERFLLQVRYAMTDFEIKTEKDDKCVLTKDAMDKVLVAFGDEKKQRILDLAFALSDDATITLFDGDTYRIDKTIFFKKYMIVAGIDTKENFIKYQNLDEVKANILKKLIADCFLYDFFEACSDVSFSKKFEELSPRWALVDHLANFDLLLHALDVITKITNSLYSYYFCNHVVFGLFHSGLLTINNLNIFCADSVDTEIIIQKFLCGSFLSCYDGRFIQSNASPKEDVLRLFLYSDTDFVDRIRPFCGKFEDFLAHFKSKQKQLSLRLEFRSVFLPLNDIETDALLEKIKNHSLDTIRDGVDLGLALQGLNGRQCKALLEIMGDRLPNIIRNGLQLGLALQYLNKEQCQAFLEVIDVQLPLILCNSTQIKIVLLCLKEDTKKIVLERIHHQVLDVITKEYDGKDILSYLNNIEQNLFPIFPNKSISQLKDNALNMYSLLFDKIRADIEEKVLVIVSPDRSEPRPSGSGDPHAKARGFPLPNGRGSVASGKAMTESEENIADSEEIDSDFMASVTKTVDLVKRLRAQGQITNQQSLDLMEKTNQLIQDPSLYNVFLATAKGYEHVAGGKLSAYMMLICGWAAKILTLTYLGNDWINEAKEKLEQIKIVENVAECSQRQVKHANDRFSFTLFRNSCGMGESDLGNRAAASEKGASFAIFS